MRITYYALREVQVVDDYRQPGDLVPEAAEWPFLAAYVRDGDIAPVLVATLPQETQDMLLEWEAVQRAESTTPGDGASAATAATNQKVSA